MAKVTVDTIELLKDSFCKEFHIDVLDKGFVKLVDFCGSDKKIEEAARQSYGEGTRSVSDREKLLRHLMRHAHTSPFEMGDVTFQIKCPIFVARQWVRHRTHSMNEYSARYSRPMDEFYLPELKRVQVQSVDNKQGSGAEATEALDFVEACEKMNGTVMECYNFYEKQDLARELNRINMPVSNYTIFTWKQNLHNLFHFLGLRLDHHAQFEMREFAEAMAKIIKELFPISCQAFEDYKLNGAKFSQQEISILKKLVGGEENPSFSAYLNILLDESGMTTREEKEFLHKLKGEDFCKAFESQRKKQKESV